MKNRSKMKNKSPTTKELFDHVEAHLLAQDEKSKSGWTCVYYGRKDLKCAIGCLIDDEHYKRSLEGKTLDRSSPVRDAVERSIGRDLNLEEVEMLEELQQIHDSQEAYDWPEELDRLHNRLFKTV